MKSADEWLRKFLGKPARGILPKCLGGAVVLLFVLLASRKHLAQAGEGGVRLLTLLMLALPMALGCLFVLREMERRQESLFHVCLGLTLVLCGMFARLLFLDRANGDFEFYLSDWIRIFRENTFSGAMCRNVGEYQVLYQYILFLISRLPVSPLYAVKTVSFVGDVLLAWGVVRLSQPGRAEMAFGAALLVPTFVLNGSMFAQCDSLFCACALLALSACMQDRPLAASALFALSLSFKLQAVFLFPVIPALWFHRKLDLRGIGVFVLTLLVCAVPALAGGKSIGGILSIYTTQTGIYTGLNYGSPGFFALLNSQGLDSYAYGTLGILLAMGSAILWQCRFASEEADRDNTLFYACVTVLCVVYFLPRMHERYFYLGEALCLALTARDRRTLPAALLVILSSFSAYLQTAVPLGVASLMIPAAVCLLAAGKRTHSAGSSCLP